MRRKKSTGFSIVKWGKTGKYGSHTGVTTFKTIINRIWINIYKLCMYRHLSFWIFGDVIFINIMFFIALLHIIQIFDWDCVTPGFLNGLFGSGTRFLDVVCYILFWSFGRALWLLKIVLIWFTNYYYNICVEFESKLWKVQKLLLCSSGTTCVHILWMDEFFTRCY